MEGLRSIVGHSVQGDGAERRPQGSHGRDRRWLRSRVTRVTHALRRAGQRAQRSLKALCSLSSSSTTSRPPGRERAVADSDRGQCWGRARCAIKTLKRDCNACPLPRFPAFLTSPSLQVFTSPFLSPHSSGDPICPPASRSSRFPRIFIPILRSIAFHCTLSILSVAQLPLLISVFSTAVCLSHQSLENSA
jgi:hypothetical protein